MAHDEVRLPFIEMECNATIEEYRNITSEIQQRLQHQQQTTSYIFAAVGGLVAITQALPNLVNLYPVISILFSAFALQFLEQDYMIAYLAAYLNTQLRPKMDNLLTQGSKRQPNIWAWDDFRIKWQFGSYKKSPYILLLGAARHAFTVIPAATLIVLYVINRNPQQVFMVEDLLAIPALLVLTGVILISRYTARLYYDITNKNAWKQGRNI